MFVDGGAEFGDEGDEFVAGDEAGAEGVEFSWGGGGFEKRFEEQICDFQITPISLK